MKQATITLTDPRTGDRAGRLTASGSTRKKAVSAVKRLASRLRISLGRPAAGRRRNIAAGFYDEDSQFHPIRASYDYDPKRAGEGSSRKVKSRRRNIAAGFYDEDSQFHPIRASYDYDPKRAGEGSTRRKVKSPKSKAKRRRNPIFQSKSAAEKAASEIRRKAAQYGEAAIVTITPRRDPGGVIVYELQWRYK